MDQFIDRPDENIETTTYSEHPRKKSSGSLGKNLLSLILILAIGVLFGLGIKSFLTIFDPPAEVTEIRGELPVPTPTNAVGTIAFTREGNLFLFENGVERQLTTTGDVGKFKWSPDGKSIAFIKTKTFTYQNNEGSDPYEWTQTLGSGIALWYVDQGEVIDIVAPKYTDEQLKLSHMETNADIDLKSLDFSSDGQKIVFVQDGVWVSEIGTQNTMKIADNDYKVMGNETDDEIYMSAEWNPQFQSILLYRGIWECGKSELYDVVSQKIASISIPVCVNGFWKPDGLSMLFYSMQGIGDASLLSVDAKTFGINEILTSNIHNANEVRSVFSVAVSGDNRMIAVVGPLLGNETVTSDVLPYLGNNIYIITDEKRLVPLTKDADWQVGRHQLSWSPKMEQISYLQSNLNSSAPITGADLHILNSNGTNDQVVVQNISDYAWQPVSSN